MYDLCTSCEPSQKAIEKDINIELHKDISLSKVEEYVEYHPSNLLIVHKLVKIMPSSAQDDTGFSQPATIQNPKNIVTQVRIKKMMNPFRLSKTRIPPLTINRSTTKTPLICGKLATIFMKQLLSRCLFNNLNFSSILRSSARTDSPRSYSLSRGKQCQWLPCHCPSEINSIFKSHKSTSKTWKNHNRSNNPS